MKKVYYNSPEEELEVAKLVAEKDISEDSSDNSVDVNMLNDDFGNNY